MQILDKRINHILNHYLRKLEKHFDADVIFYYGEIHPSYEKPFRDFIEDLKKNGVKREKLAIILNTPGGSAETVEKMAVIIRHHYKEVYFIVPDYAMSAGTIFCMSGDKIYMDYSSSLGPIDPQVFVGEYYVPALGYLDKVNEMLDKSAADTLTDAEFAILQSLDLAQLRSYEQARDLTVSSLKEWLVKYKFKNWLTHRTDPHKLGSPVTLEEKEARASEIAKNLGDNKKWNSHERSITIAKLCELGLEIEDYSDNLSLRTLIRDYNDVLDVRYLMLDLTSRYFEIRRSIFLVRYSISMHRNWLRSSCQQKNIEQVCLVADRNAECRMPKGCRQLDDGLLIWNVGIEIKCISTDKNEVASIYLPTNYQYPTSNIYHPPPNTPSPQYHF